MPPIEDESLRETLEILAEPGLLAAVRAGEADHEGGEYVTLDEIRADLRARAARGG